MEAQGREASEGEDEEFSLKHREPEVLGPRRRAGERVVASGQTGLGVTGMTDVACEVRREVRTSWKRPRKGRRPGLSPEDPSIQEECRERSGQRKRGGAAGEVSEQRMNPSLRGTVRRPP